MECSLPVSSSMGFPRQEYWNGLPFPSPGDLPHPGIELTSLVSVYNGIKTSVVAERSYVAHQASLSMGFSRQEYWSGLPFPSPGDLPHPGVEPGSPALQADA